MGLIDNLLGKEPSSCSVQNTVEEGSTEDILLTEYIDRMQKLLTRYYSTNSLYEEATEEKEKFYESEYKDIFKDMAKWADEVDFNVFLEETENDGEKETYLYTLSCPAIYHLRKFIRFQTPIAFGKQTLAIAFANDFFQMFSDKYELECMWGVTISRRVYCSTAKEVEKEFDGIVEVTILEEDKSEAEKDNDNGE